MKSRDFLYSLGLALAAWPPLFERAPKPPAPPVALESESCDRRTASLGMSAKVRKDVCQRDADERP